ncbi:MAG: metal ABC transporter ATP-binding protein [Anaerolineales bacterium]|nr:metal ABC transporter ATP-binding protein [Anaerolineales bacterium]
MKNLIETFRKQSFSRRYAPHHPDAPLLELEEITVSYETGKVLDQISFGLTPGIGVAVVGPNGAGKTTLFKVIAGILDPDSGIVRVSGHEPGGHTCIAYVPQRSQVDWSFPATVADVVMMGRINKMGPFLWPQADDWEVVRRSLKFVNLIDYSQRQISELSGGEQQRMFIARALAQEAELMLLDEPLNGLDVPAQESILVILQDLLKREVTFMISMHDLRLAAEQFDHVMLLNKELLGFGSPEEVLTRDLLLKGYQGHLHFVEGDYDTLAVGDDCCEGDHNELH